jgi:putative FmdB family regulatory protein
MPTYDYLCPNGHRFEVIHSVIADGPTSCPICGAAPVRKAFSAPSIHFKGSGWAKKDRSTSRRSTVPSSASADGDTATTSSSGSDNASGSDGGSGRGSSSDGGSASDRGSGSDGGSGSERGSGSDKGPARDAKPGGDKPSSSDKGSKSGSTTGDAKAGG